MSQEKTTEHDAGGASDSTALLAATENLHKRVHDACPFMTLQTGGVDGIAIKMQFKNYDDAADVHDLLVKFFSANAKAHRPHDD